MHHLSRLPPFFLHTTTIHLPWPYGSLVSWHFLWWPLTGREGTAARPQSFLDLFADCPIARALGLMKASLFRGHWCTLTCLDTSLSERKSRTSSCQSNRYLWIGRPWPVWSSRHGRCQLSASALIHLILPFHVAHDIFGHASGKILVGPIQVHFVLAELV